MRFIDFIRDAFALLFPELCASCKQALVYQEKQICTECIYHLPKTDFHLDPDNLAARQLMGRVPIVAASSFLYYSYGSSVQEIIHHLKYKQGFATAQVMGELYGLELKESAAFCDFDFIVPVPLHKKRLRSRGYNQSAYFAQGLSKSLKIPSHPGNLIRKTYNESQVQSGSRYERYENTRNIFDIKNPQLLQGKHILLVDDVLTTGATLEACSETLLTIPDVKVSVATIAFAK